MSTSVFSVEYDNNKKLTKMKLYIYHILQAIFALKQRVFCNLKYGNIKKWGVGAILKASV
jgi:hypothetical protein